MSKDRSLTMNSMSKDHGAIRAVAEKKGPSRRALIRGPSVECRPAPAGAADRRRSRMLPVTPSIQSAVTTPT
jgi:hypothetical protein